MASCEMQIIFEKLIQAGHSLILTLSVLGSSLYPRTEIVNIINWHPTSTTLGQTYEMLGRKI